MPVCRTIRCQKCNVYTIQTDTTAYTINEEGEKIEFVNYSGVPTEEQKNCKHVWGEGNFNHVLRGDQEPSESWLKQLFNLFK